MEIDEASGPLHLAAGDSARDAARLADLWQRFSEAGGETAFCSSWLALQCSMLGAAARAAVVLGAPDTGPFAPVAFWPSAHERSAQLAEIAERALAERRGILTRQPQDRGVAEAFPNAIAYPLLVDGHLYGVVAVELARCPE